MSAMHHLAHDHSQQLDLFIAYFLYAVPKADIASMEHPLFALRAGDKSVRSYERNGVTIKVKPGPDGCATIHDKDLWIYCTSLLVEAKNRELEIGRTVRFVAHDFLVATNRGTSGRAYERMTNMLARLKGTTIETNIETAGQRERRGFGLIDAWRVVEKSHVGGRMVAIEVTLPDWLMRSVQSMQVLTLSSDYFRLRRPLDRRIYELGRKHCGAQARWRVSVATLHQKCGSASTLREFRRQLKNLSESGEMPDYRIAVDAARDVVTYYAYGPKANQAEARDVLTGRPKTSTKARQNAHQRKSRRR